MCYMRLLTGVVILLAGVTSCADDTLEPDPYSVLPQPADSTSHGHNWKVYALGNYGSRIVALAAGSDKEVWIAGDFDLPFVIKSIPGGRDGQFSNLVHWDGEEIEYFAIEGKRSDGRWSTYTPFSVEMVDGNPMLIGVDTYSKFGGTFVHTEKLPQDPFNPQTPQHSRKGSGGHIYLYGYRGFVGRFFYPYLTVIQKFPTETDFHITALAEVRPEEVYYGTWNDKTGTGIYYRSSLSGEVEKLAPEFNGHTLDYCTAIWVGENVIHAALPPFIYMEAKDNRYVRDGIRVSQAIGATWYGAIECAVGRADNDVFYAGHFGHVYHYNGRSLIRYDELYEQFPDAVFRQIAVSENRVFLGGKWRGQCLFIVGTPAG